MGRTLHYSIKKDNGSAFTMKEKIAMYEVSKFYNSDTLLKEINEAYKTDLKELWTCENFWLGVGSYYPNWNVRDNSWEKVNEEFAKLENSGMHFIDIVETLVKKGVISTHVDDKNEFRGFTKVQGNEFNSLLVLNALVQISKSVKTATIELSDEGEFLLCKLKIKNGRVLPIISDLVEDIQYYSAKMLFSEGFSGNILNKIEPKDFCEEFKKDIGIENGYGDMTEYINRRLRNLKEIQNALTKEGLTGHKLYFYNIENLSSEDWFMPISFTRNVNVEKFINYEMNEATLMDGFDGEGFGLTDEDAEQKSYKAIANMMKLLGNSGHLHILGRK